MTDEIDTSAERVEWLSGMLEIMNEGWGSEQAIKMLRALRAERDAERQRAEKAEAEVERLTGLYASGCVEEYDNGDRVCVWGWAGGASPGGHLSTLSVSYEAADGSRWNRTYRATEGWEEAPLAALRQD